MSGVAGADRIKSRADFEAFVASYEPLVAKFPGFVDLRKSGSYNSDPDKQDFGDIDLIAHIQSNDDKATTKKKLQAFFHSHPETTIVPFSSVKHAGKRSYNSGEIVTVRYHDAQLGYSVQVDNIIASTDKEATFKQQFLDMPAAKQGLVLGLVKIATIETDPKILFKKLGVHTSGQLESNQEYEFNLSSAELQLRKVTYKPGTYEQLSREVIWTSKNFDEVHKLLYQYELDSDFNSLLAQTKSTIKNPRSSNRIKGVFDSMITVKSGEVGTAKAAGKQAASSAVHQTFKENRVKPHRMAKNNITDPSDLIEHVRSLRHWMAVEGVTPTFEINDVKKLCSRILYPTRLTEDLADDKLKFINQLARLDQYDSLDIKVGSKVAILNAIVTGNYIELWGFTTPKRISKITFDRDNNIKGFEFNNDPTDIYPRTDLSTYRGEEIQHSAFFGDGKSAEQAITQLGLVNSGSFKIRNHIKENAIKEVTENRSIFRSLMEVSIPKKVVFAFGRFQPPTVGHELLINTIKQTAEKNTCPYVIYVSRTQDHKANPLDIGTKMHYLKTMFPSTNFVAADNAVRTPIEAAKHLNQNATELIMAAGSDRVAGFQQLLNQYNGKEYNYSSIQVVSVGSRDPDSDTVEGMSGTKMREAALANNFETFQQGLPSTISGEDAEQLMLDVAAGLQKPVRQKKAKENANQQGSDVVWKRGMSSPGYAQTYHNTDQTGGTV